MPQSLAHIALIVRDYDEAIAWFTEKLGFTLVADEYQPEQDKPGAISAEGGSEIATSKRWVLVAPPGAGDNAATLLLARGATPEQAAFIGNQAGGRVFLFLKTDDFDRDYQAYRARGVREPATHAYGKVAVFEDLYGNLWDLVQSA
jgi:catechol 2,3-dioxygenase-like lactoylglutathione lyase family enzyme